MTIKQRKFYPEIQRTASKNSKIYQRLSFFLISANLIVLVLAAFAGAFNFSYFSFAYPKSSLLVLSILIAYFSSLLHLKQKWYASRSLSETVKSLTWRYYAQALPFGDSDIESGEAFHQSISLACTESNHLIGHEKFKVTRLDSSMDISIYTFEQKAAFYTSERLRRQLAWYTEKSRTNRSMGLVCLWIFVLCNCIAVYFSIQEESGDSGSMSAIFIAIATAFLGWIEAKKYDELAAAYRLTKCEIEKVILDVHLISNDLELSRFVTEAEGLFSREHTQWAAKRGYIRATAL
ncbi:DUF4231 domain-containing protein [Pseudomonas yamanorum]|uniref:DUF4231 domain-containing protein n=1 Tax=Pseudomonas yamanorum TaxID=515393 RepID=UPI00159FE079|nr:DUF4231 domain-containing protein [Pseudomonas yamanorum]NWD22464.1 DUF4231 domain-containing protein [Pseudomonas yamanorum]